MCSYTAALTPGSIFTANRTCGSVCHTAENKKAHRKGNGPAMSNKGGLLGLIHDDPTLRLLFRLGFLGCHRLIDPLVGNFQVSRTRRRIVALDVGTLAV